MSIRASAVSASPVTLGRPSGAALSMMITRVGYEVPYRLNTLPDTPTEARIW